MDQSSGHRLWPLFQKRAVVRIEKPIRDMNAKIRVDPDELGIECGVVNFRKFMGINDDMGCIEEHGFRQRRNGTTAAVRRQHGISESRLV
jgi:hypothetical protein